MKLDHYRATQSDMQSIAKNLNLIFQVYNSYVDSIVRTLTLDTLHRIPFPAVEFEANTSWNDIQTFQRIRREADLLKFPIIALEGDGYDVQKKCIPFSVRGGNNHTDLVSLAQNGGKISFDSRLQVYNF